MTGKLAEVRADDQKQGAEVDGSFVGCKIVSEVVLEAAEAEADHVKTTFFMLQCAR